LNSTKDAITGPPDFEQIWNHDALGNWDDVTTNGITGSATLRTYM